MKRRKSRSRKAEIQAEEDLIRNPGRQEEDKSEEENDWDLKSK